MQMVESKQLLIILFLLLVPTLYHVVADAQSASQPVAPYALRDNVYPPLSVGILVIVCAFLFMGFFSIYLRYCAETYLLTVPIGSTVDCSCSRRGIDPKVIDTFPILVYSTIKDLKIGKGALECAVCLSEFKDYETLRLLPNCSHLFHPDCIGAWLASHVTCPVCRANLNPDCGEVAIAIPTEINSHEALDESFARSAELGAAEQQASVPNMNESGSINIRNIDGYIGKQNHSSKSTKSRTFGKLVRSHSTGHSLIEPGKSLERYTLRLPEEVRKHILVNHGTIRRSASCNVVLAREKKDSVERQTWRLDRWVLSMTPRFDSRG